MKKKFFVLSSLVLSIIIGILLLRFGTLSPCGMLKKEFYSKFVQAAFEEESKDEWELAGKSLGMALAGPMLDSMIDSLTPTQ